MSFKDAWEALATDAKQGQIAREANLHAMKGLDETGRYQDIDAAKLNAKRLAEDNLKEGKYGVVGHGLQDEPGHNWESMKDYSSSLLNWISHQLKDIFPSPSTFGQAIKNTADFMKNRQETLDRVYGPLPSQGPMSYEMLGISAEIENSAISPWLIDSPQVCSDPSFSYLPQSSYVPWTSDSYIPY
jgi:hypothetical protein